MAPTAGAGAEQRDSSALVPEHSQSLTRLSHTGGASCRKKYYEVMDPFVVMGVPQRTRPEDATGICWFRRRDRFRRQVGRQRRSDTKQVLCGVGAAGRPTRCRPGPTSRAATSDARGASRPGGRFWTQTNRLHASSSSSDDDDCQRQKPHPPVLVGGGLPYGARRALAYGDGWMPHARRPTYRLLDKLPEYREMEKAAGRTLPITAFGAEHDPAAWPAYRDAGIERIVLSIDSATSDVILPKLDQWAAKLAQVE